MDSWEDKYGRYFMNNDNGIAHFQELHDHIIIISPSLLWVYSSVTTELLAQSSLKIVPLAQ